MRAQHKNNKWELVELPSGKRVVGYKWVFTAKAVEHKVDGSMKRYKAKLVAKCFTHTHGIDYEEIFPR
jgi:hypothetical protein